MKLTHDGQTMPAEQSGSVIPDGQQHGEPSDSKMHIHIITKIKILLLCTMELIEKTI